MEQSELTYGEVQEARKRMAEEARKRMAEEAKKEVVTYA